MSRLSMIFFALPFLLTFSSPILAKSAKKPTPAPKLPIKIVVLGDSITEGFGIPKEEAFPAILEQILNAKKNGLKVEVINAGISGSTSASGPGRLNWALKSKPTLVLIELGANDGLRGQDPLATKKNLKAMIRACKETSVNVMLVGMKLPPNYGADYRKKFESVFSDLAKEENVPLIPFFDEFFGKKGLLQNDGLHPNKNGHKLIAEKLSEIVVKQI